MDLIVLYLIIYILAAVCFVVYSFGIIVNRVNLMGLGLFFFVLVPLIQTIQRV